MNMPGLDTNSLLEENGSGLGRVDSNSPKDECDRLWSEWRASARARRANYDAPWWNISNPPSPGGSAQLQGGRSSRSERAVAAVKGAIVAAAQKMLQDRSLEPNLIVDCSHGNSNKDHERQKTVFNELIERRAANKGLVGLMLESNLNEGSQTLGEPSELEYGVSITDACIGWDETDALVRSAYGKLGA